MKEKTKCELLEQIARLEQENNRLEIEIELLKSMAKPKEYVPYPLYPTCPELPYPPYSPWATWKELPCETPHTVCDFTTSTNAKEGTWTLFKGEIPWHEPICVY